LPCESLKLEKPVMVGSVAVYAPKPHFLCNLQFWSRKLAIQELVVLVKNVRTPPKNLESCVVGYGTFPKLLLKRPWNLGEGAWIYSQSCDSGYGRLNGSCRSVATNSWELTVG
jgi:hypothetical protein